MKSISLFNIFNADTKIPAKKTNFFDNYIYLLKNTGFLVKKALIYIILLETEIN